MSIACAVTENFAINMYALKLEQLTNYDTLRTGHLTDNNTSLLNQDTLLTRTPHKSGHLTNQDTSLVRTPHKSGHLTNQDTS